VVSSVEAAFGDILTAMTAEHIRLKQSLDRTANWQRWGPYLAERQWGTVREDLLGDRRVAGLISRTTTPEAAPIAGARTDCWESVIASAASVFSLALWNGKDLILKERLFGLTGARG